MLRQAGEQFKVMLRGSCDRGVVVQFDQSSADRHPGFLTLEKH
jgi:hypothetical protein